MAGIFDDLRDKGNGILSDLNNYLFTDSSSSLRENVSNTLMPPTSEILNRLQTQQQKEKIFTPDKISNYFSDLTAPAPASSLSYRTDAEKQAAILNEQKTNQSKNVNARVPKPKDPAENTFLGAVGEYFNNAQTTWKDKGGFDALMSNPQFGIGLSLLQQASEGKTIGASALKAMVDGGVISDVYAKRIAARTKIAGPVTGAEREMARAVLAESDLGGTASISTKFKNFFSNKNTDALNARALDDIAERARANIEKESGAGRGKTTRTNREHYEDATKQLLREGVIKLDEGFWVLGGGVQSTKGGLVNYKDIPDKNKRQLGGPVTQGKAYLVGEVGPEVFIPKETGKIVSTDDSKIINLLLESNPQLKNVSPARAEKILRNRFPDYFE